MEDELLSRLKKMINREELIELTENLISIESHLNAINCEEEVGFFVNNLLLENGIDSRLQKVDDHRYNVIARIEGKDRSKNLLLTGHMDTVGDYGYSELFIPKKRDNKIFGRGTSDMKGPIASMIMAMLAIKKLNIIPNWNITLGLVVDEEFKSIGTEKLITGGLKADAAILGEPTKMNVCPGNRGLEWVDIVVTGKGTHGGTAEQGINAISMAARLIETINNTLIPKLKERTHPILTNSSMNFGVISGGYQPSTVPDKCTIKIDRRWIYGESVGEIYKEYQSIIDKLASEDKNFKAELSRDLFNMNEMEHGPVCLEDNHPLISNLLEVSQIVAQKTPEVNVFPGWTDASLLTNYGNIPTVIFGPGDISCAHSEREFIDIDELYDSSLIYAYIAINYIGKRL